MPVHVCMYACMHAEILFPTCMYVWSRCVHACIYVCILLYMYVSHCAHAHVYVCRNPAECTFMYVGDLLCVYVHMCRCGYTESSGHTLYQALLPFPHTFHEALQPKFLLSLRLLRSGTQEPAQEPSRAPLPFTSWVKKQILSL